MKTPALAAATLRGTTWISRDGLRELRRKDRLWVLPLAGLGIVVGLAVVVFMLLGVYRSLLTGGAAMGHPELLMFYGVLGSWAFQFVTAIPLVLSVLYYSQDLKMLLTLPVRPRQIVLGKSLLLYGYCLPVNLLLLVPALVLYLGAVGPEPAAIVSAAVHLLVTPLLPLSLAGLLVIGLMKVVNLSRWRLALEVAGMALGIVLLIGFQIILSRSTLSSLEGGPQTLAGLTAAWESLQAALPPLAWAAAGFVPGAGPAPVLLVLALTALVGAAALGLAPVNFLHDVMERREVSRRGRRRVAAADVLVPTAGRSVMRRLVGREWAILSSNSTFIFEAVGELLVLPLVLGVYGLILPKTMISQAMQFVSGMPMLGIALMGIVVLMTSLTTVSSTSISREGPRLGLSLMMPVPGRVQVRAKLVFHLLLFTSAYLADLVLVWVLFRFPLISLAYMVPGGIALQVAAFSVSIFFDLKRPILNWTHPQQAMKNNMNALSGIGTSAALAVGATAPFALLSMSTLQPLVAGCLSAAVSVILAAILLPRVLAFADRQYAGGLEVGG
jgi:ABC-2 type transport system permease protein